MLELRIHYSHVVSFNIEDLLIFFLLEPLEAILGEDLTIVCSSPIIGGAQGFTLRRDGVLFQDRRIFIQPPTPATSNEFRVFVLRNTVPSDNGIVLECVQAERRSNSATVQLICKLVPEMKWEVPSCVCIKKVL